MGIEVIGQLILATILGSVLGLEREIKRKEAGLQTYSLVTLGACLFSVVVLSLVNAGLIKEPSFLVMAIGVGMGFIGAGAIFRGEGKVEGLTTAAGLWISSAIGLAVGVQLYLLAIFATFLTLLIFSVFGFLERKFLEKVK